VRSLLTASVLPDRITSKAKAPYGRTFTGRTREFQAPSDSCAANSQTQCESQRGRARRNVRAEGRFVRSRERGPRLVGWAMGTPWNDVSEPESLVSPMRSRMVACPDCMKRAKFLSCASCDDDSASCECASVARSDASWRLQDLAQFNQATGSHWILSQYFLTVAHVCKQHRALCVLQGL
jgi:hypothetical protein